MIKLYILIIAILLSQYVKAQAGAGVKYGNKHQAYVDSIKRSNYIWMFPAWGKRITKKGFDLPYPAGVMLNTYVGTQKVEITDLKVGINNRDPVPLEFIKFGEVKANLQTVNIRPDLWVLPFMDLYGLAGLSYAQTDVAVVEPVPFSTTAKFKGHTFGLGATFAGGYHTIIGIIDINHTWTHLSHIKGAIQATMFTPRLGKNFLFKNNPEKNIAVWIGAPGFFINRTTEGTINLSDLHSTKASKTDMENIVNETAGWYQNLTTEQKYVVRNIAQNVLNKINGIDSTDATISYSLIKRPVSNWSMCVGGQIQLNHRWQIRTEVGFFGGRESVLLSGNYRFRW